MKSEKQRIKYYLIKTIRKLIHAEVTQGIPTGITVENTRENT